MQIHTYAKECNSIGLQRELIKGDFVDSRDEYDFTPLAYVATSPDLGETALQLLIEAGADVTHPYPHFRTRQTRNPNGFA